MAPGKDNLAESVSILTQRQLDKFIQEYRIPLDLNPVLPSKNETIYPFRQGKFPLYTRVCNFANYRVPFSKFLIRVLQYFRVHLCQVNPFGLSRINHFEFSCWAQHQRPDLDRPDWDVFRYFYEFITAGDWYTFAHRKGLPPPSGDERSSLKNWKDNFFWLDDCCLPVEMVWRFKDQTMSFDLGEDFVFNKELARALIEHKSPICPLPKHLLLWGWVCFSWGGGDRDWPVIRTKRERKNRDVSQGCIENPNVSGKGDGENQGGAKVVMFSDMFSDDMEVDPNNADDKFIPEWDIRNKDSVMNDLKARMFLFYINTPLDHARSRKMKNQDLGAAVLLNQAQSNVFVMEVYRRWIEAESMKEGLEKEILSLKRKMQGLRIPRKNVPNLLKIYRPRGRR
ncbi:hypothetical protein Hdeb2414_s0013g00410811 [Helianthus debilis subsp. tardiflorus]